MEWKKQKTARIYLHPYRSARLVMLLRDFKIANVELTTTNHTDQNGASLALLGSDMEQLPWRESRFDEIHGDAPVYTLRTTDPNGADVTMTSFCSTDEIPAAYLRVMVTNNTANKIGGSVSCYPCTGKSRYLTGLWDTGYQSYMPNIRAQYMLTSHYGLDADGVLTDGYAAVRVLACDKTSPEFVGKVDHYFKPSNYFRFAYSLFAGESCTFDLVHTVGRPAAELSLDDALANTRAYWDALLSRVTKYPAAPSARYHDIYRMQIVNCLLMLQRYSDGRVYPRQGCIGQFIWAWEAAYFLTALDRIGFCELTAEAYRTLFEAWQITDEDSDDYGKLANPNVNWANTNGSAIWGLSEHLLYSGSREEYEEFLPMLLRAMAWVEDQRLNHTKEGDIPHLFPSAKASDWPEVGQHYTYTDSVNVMGYRSLLRVCEKFGAPETEQVRACYEDYFAALTAAMDSLVEGHSDDEDYMPTHILGIEFENIRTHCHASDGIPYLPMCGNLDPDSRLFRFMERHYERHGLFEHNMRSRISNLDFGTAGLYGDVYYTNVPEISWFYAYMQRGDRDRAWQMLERIFFSNLTDEYVTSERYTPLDEWFVPWQPNASASGRIISAMLDFWGEDKSCNQNKK